MDYFNYNGKLFESGTPVIEQDNRGLRYGDGLFETIKVLNGLPIRIEEHLVRLWKGLAMLKFELPVHFTASKLKEEIIALVYKNKHQKSARIRITVFRGNGGLYDLKNHFPNYIIQSFSLSETAGKFNENGLVCGFYTDIRKSCDEFSNIKHSNFLPYVMAAIEAKKCKWNDALIMNQYYRVCDSTIANLFIVKDEKIFTPSLSEGCIAGITRKFVIEKLHQNGIELIETTLNKEDILKADEVFLTNAIRNVQWVGQIENSKYGFTFSQRIYDWII